MISISPPVLLTFCLLCSQVKGIELHPAEIGRILGYPASEILITEVTQKERDIYSRRTVGEAERGETPPIRADQIIAAYRVTGKTPASFYPILVTVAREGALLSSAFADLSAKIDAVPVQDRQKQRMGHLGKLQFKDLGAGGFIIGELRAPSPIKEMSYPSSRMAMIAELRLPDVKADVRIAVCSALDEGGKAELKEIPGGERYYEFFRSKSGSLADTSPEPPPFDWTDGIKVLFTEVKRSIREDPLKDTETDSVTAPNKSETIIQAGKSVNNEKSTSVTDEMSVQSGWTRTRVVFIFLMALIAIFVVWTVGKKRK